MVFFIVGDERDWVPCSSRSGPFVTVYETIFKNRYKLGKNTRSALLRTAYMEQGHRGSPTEIARINVKDASNLRGTCSRIKVYKFRRLPSLTRHQSEIVPLREFLKKAEGHNALVANWSVAFELMSDFMRQYRYLANNTAGYIGFPLSNVDGDQHADNEEDSDEVNSFPSRESQPEDRIDANARPAEIAGAGYINSSGDVLSGRNGIERDAVAASTTQENANAGNSHYAPVERESLCEGRHSSSMLRYMMHYLDLVHCDSVFMFLCMLFDERVDSKFHIIVGSFRAKYNGRSLRAPYLVNNALTYAEWKVFGVKDEKEHEDRERSLRSAKENFELVRSLYGLKSYEDMRWSFLHQIQNCVGDGGADGGADDIVAGSAEGGAGGCRGGAQVDSSRDAQAEIEGGVHANTDLERHVDAERGAHADVEGFFEAYADGGAQADVERGSQIGLQADADRGVHVDVEEGGGADVEPVFR